MNLSTCTVAMPIHFEINRTFEFEASFLFLTIYLAVPIRK